MNTKITICIPTHNRAHFLSEAIKSVLAQSYRNFELFILDNFSDDTTESVVSNFNDQRLHYQKSNYKLSLADSLNRSFDICKTEYLLIFHDDDILHKDFLLSNLSVIDNDHKLALVASSMYVIDEKNKNIREEQVLKNDLYFNQFEYWYANYYDSIYLPMPTVIFRMSIIHKYGFRFSDKVGPNLDQFLWYQMNCHNLKFLLRKEQLYYYRKHDNQQTNWELQSILLDRVACNLAKKNQLDFVVDKINSKKTKQLNYLYEHCLYKNNSLIYDLLNEGYWNTLNLRFTSRFKIFLYRYPITRTILILNHLIREKTKI